MPNVVLVAGTGAPDPVGDRAVLAALAGALPGVEITALPAGVAGRAPRRLGQADAVVIAGETVFDGGPRRRALAAVAEVASAAAAVRSPLALVGVSAEPLARRVDRYLGRWLVRRAALLLVSDDESARALSDAGVPVPVRIGADPTWLEVGSLRAGPGGEVAVVVLDASSGAEVEARLVATLARLRREGLPLRLQPWTGAHPGEAGRPDGSQRGEHPPGWHPTGTGVPADLARARRVRQALGGPGDDVEISAPPPDLARASDALADAKVVVTERFRALHAAAEAGVPVVAYTDRARTVALARRLGQVALSPRTPPAAAAAAILAASAGPVPSPAAVKREVARAAAGFGLLRLVLDRGDAELADLEMLPLGPEPWLQ